MIFSIHIEEFLATELKDFAKQTGKSRNALIREAIQNFLSQKKKKHWPKSVHKLLGIDATFTPFEDHRADLSIPTEDPLK